MKKLFIIVLLLLAMILPAAAETDTSLLVGTWINPENDPTRETPKFVYKADGIVEGYPLSYATKPYNVYTYTVEEAWQDAEGAYWYNIVAVKIQTQENRFWYLLIRISPDGTTYEEDCIRADHREFPTEINPKSYFYNILYRE